MDSYKVSKAWHLGHDLAADIQQLARYLSSTELELAGKIRHFAAMTPQKIAESVECSLEHERVKAYKIARAACRELQQHLSLARDLHYIDEQVYQQLADKAIMVYRLLSELIQSSKQVSPRQ